MLTLRSVSLLSLLALPSITVSSRADARPEGAPADVRLVEAGAVWHGGYGGASLGEVIAVVTSDRCREKALDPRIDCLDPRTAKSDEKERGITINTSHVEYRTQRTYDHVWEESADAFVGGRLVEERRADGLVVAVSASQGVGKDVLEAIARAGELGVPSVVGWIDVDGSDADTKAAEQTEQVLRAALGRAGFDGDRAPIIRGSALGGLNKDPKWVPRIMAAAEALGVVPLPPREKDKPFLMPVDDVKLAQDQTRVLGTIETGVVTAGEAVEIVGFGGQPLKSTITGVEMFRKLLDRGEAGDNVGLLLRGIDKKDIRRGMVIARPGTIAAHVEVRAVVYKEEGGRHTPFHNKYRPTFVLRTTDVTGEIELPAGRDLIASGEHDTVTVRLIVPVAMDKGLRFAIREGGRTVGAGQVTEIVK